MKKGALLVIGIVVAVIGAVSVRGVIEGKRALAEGDAALAAKHPADAIAGWEAAARWYVPFAPHVDTAYARLIDFAKNRIPNDPKHALAAWRAVRRAAHATRTLWQPHADDLATADAAIAKLSAEVPDGAFAAGAGPSDKTLHYAARLAEDGRPSIGMAVLAILGILSWLAGIGVVVRRGFSAAGALVRRPAMVGAGMITVGLLAFAVGLYNA